MPISVTCDCGHSYQIASKNAGKKFRCKTCGEVVVVPGTKSGTKSRRKSSLDHYEEFAEDSDAEDYEDYEAEDEYGYDYEEPAPPIARKSRQRPKSRKSRRKRRGMPPSVMVAIGCEGLLIPFNLLNILGNLATFNCGAVLVCVFRIALEIACIIGFINKQTQARWASIISSIIGIVFFSLFLALLSANVFGIKQKLGALEAGVVVFNLLQIGILGALVVCLFLPSAADHFD